MSRLQRLRCWALRRPLPGQAHRGRCKWETETIWANSIVTGVPLSVGHRRWCSIPGCPIERRDVTPAGEQQATNRALTPPGHRWVPGYGGYKLVENNTPAQGELPGADQEVKS